MSATPAPVSRDTTWDIARGIGMALVIYGHLLEPMYPARADLGRPLLMDSAFSQWQVIYSFHMMLFFFVSGAVNRNLWKKPFADVFRSSLRLLALAWIVHLLGCGVAMALGSMPSPLQSPGDAARAVLMPIAEGYCWSVGVLWFLTSLCFVQLLAWLCLRRMPALAVTALGIVGTALVVYVEAPNQYLLRTWMPGLAFFALGAWLAAHPVRWPIWAFAPLLLATVLLAPLNNGCAFTVNDACQQFGTPPFGVRMFGGGYGFLPMFFLSALVGTVAIISLSAVLARLRQSDAIAFLGRNSLELFVINGFVATFLPPMISGLHWPELAPWHYAGLFVAVIAIHVVALLLLKRPLGWLNAASVRLAGALASPLSAREANARPPQAR